MTPNSILESLDPQTRASIAAIASPLDRAEAIERAMVNELSIRIVKPFPCNPLAKFYGSDKLESDPSRLRFLMGDDPRLAPMPDRPTLKDFFKHRFGPAEHLLQCAKIALNKGHDEKIVVACLLHDISLYSLYRTDHGYWGAQLIEPYVDEEISWAVRYHQVLKFYPDAEVGFEVPPSYAYFFGKDYQPEPYIEAAYQYARNHPWYMSARLVTLNDVYALDSYNAVDLDEFTDIIGRNFRQPKEGLGFDGSPVAHMWRSIIWPNNFL